MPIGLSPNEPLFAYCRGAIKGVLAIVIQTQGPSYRSVGATMVFTDDGARVGSLSSGCIEADLKLHADRVRNNKLPANVQYGAGSPFKDIVLPCGGALEILLIPQPEPAELALINMAVLTRQTINVNVSLQSGKITKSNSLDQSIGCNLFSLTIEPALQFIVFGKGPEATMFAQLAETLGYPGTLLSPDPETLAALEGASWATKPITRPHCPDDLSMDERTAILLFFHDHEWEAPILKYVLSSNAFYIGCQGSRKTSEVRLAQLKLMGLSQTELNRLRGPIGLIPSTRDPATLGVSVLAEVLGLANEPSKGGEPS
ncbi:XdhC family protein [Planktotalea frisia]|uniref:XdhC family protein n=1 Tax=Planktotalea frisia TaxID=696762 RepID=UPI002352D077|nr:XdhC family protein [Planktotalea frisia]